MDDLRLTDTDKARLFPGAISREQAGMLPLADVESDPLSQPPLKGNALTRWWARVWDDGHMTLASSARQRVHAAWRLTRQLAILRGVLQADEPLHEIGNQVGWLDSTFTSFQAIPDVHTQRLCTAGAAMTCPPVPSQFVGPRGQVDPTYDPHDDLLLRRFANLVQHVGHLHMQMDSLDSVRAGFAWFSSLNTIRAGWPSPRELCVHELSLADQMVELLTEGPEVGARRSLAETWELPPGEVQQVFALASASLVDRARLDDRDAYKALMLHRLEHLADRAGDAFDYRGAAMIRREQWRIFESQGEKDLADEFSNMDQIVALSASSKQKKLTNKPKPKD